MTNQPSAREKTGIILQSAVIGLVLALIWFFVIITVLESRDSLIENEKQHLDRLVGSLTVQTESLISNINRDFLLIDLWLQQNPQADPRTDVKFLELVDTLRRNSNGRVDYRMVSETGGLFYIPSKSNTPLADVSDREYYKAQQNPSTRGFYIAPSVKSRVTMKWGIPISYPLSRPAGGMTVIFAALELDSLHGLFENLRPKPNGAISFNRTDNLLLTRAPLKEELIGKAISSREGNEFLAGTSLIQVYTQISPVDGLEKLVAYGRPSVNSTFFITCSIALNDVLVSWNDRFTLTLVTLILLSLLLIFMGAKLVGVMSNLGTSNRELLRATEAKGRFLANMSHEIRTPLNGIIGLLDILPRDNLSADQLDLVEDLARSSTHLHQIIDEILDWSRIEAGKLTSESLEFSLRDLVSQTIGLFTPEAQKKSLTLSLDWAANLPDRLVGDPLKIRQILTNLISNGLKFTPSGGVSVTASLDRDKVKILVWDTGIGMSRETQTRLFNPFHQGDASTTRKYGGTGLGLAISRELARFIGGTLEVESHLGHGSVFTLEIPYKAAKPLEEGAARQKDLVPTFTRPWKILIVEDTPLNAKILFRQLKTMGLDPHLASHGYEALAKVQSTSYDLILMDIQMPEMDGYQATEKIRQLGEPWSSLPIIALTAHAMEGEKERCLAAGMNDHLTKPVDLPHLARLVYTLLEKPGV